MQSDLYSAMNISYLREIAEGINLTFRSHAGKNKDELLSFLCRKIGEEKMNIVFRMYLSCHGTKDVVEVIRPKGMIEIVNAVKKFFKAPQCIREATVGDRRCDLVFFDGEDIEAVEVKSALDNLSSAMDQVQYYKKWANRVHLAYDVKHRRTVRYSFFLRKGIGLLEFEDGKIRVVNNARTQQKKKVDLLSLMTYNYLRRAASQYGVNLKGNKFSIAECLAERITSERTKKIFQDFLKARTSI